MIIPLHITAVANINVQPVVSVYIYHICTGVPVLPALQSGLIGYILKFPVAFIDIEFILLLVGGKENIRQAIIVYIAHYNACAIVKIPVAEYIEVFGIGNLVIKINTGLVGRHQLEQGICIPGFVG